MNSSNFLVIIITLLLGFSFRANADLTRRQLREYRDILTGDSATERERQHAVSQLSYHAPERSRTAHSLLLEVAQNDDFSDGLRADAIRGAANIRGFGSATHEVAMSLIQGKNARLASGAGAALQRLISAGYSRSGQELTRLLGEGESEEGLRPVRHETIIISALNYSRYSPASTHIVKRLNSTDREVAREAVNALKQLSGNNAEVREALLEVVRDNGRDSVLRSNALFALSQRANDPIRDLQIVRELVSDFNSDESTDGRRAEILIHLGWTGLVRVRDGRDTINIRQMIYDNMNGDNITLQLAGLEALERDGNYSDH